MKKNAFLNSVVSLAVCCGVLLSGSAPAFDGVRSQTTRDVELSGSGHLTGSVCTSAGLPLANKQVLLKYQGVVVAETVSGKNGNFAFSSVRGGVHELSVDSTTSQLRLWKHGSAPAGARRQVALAVGENVVRGQNGGGLGGGGLGGIGIGGLAGIAGVTAAVVSTVIAVDTQNENDDLKQENAELRDQLASP